MFSQIKYLIFSCACIAFPLGQMDALNVELGPFNFSLRGDLMVDDVATIEDPICLAMGDRDLVEIVAELEGKESPDNVARLVVEPYVLGFTDKKELVLRGVHIKEFAIPEKAADEKAVGEGQGKGMIGGIYTVFKGEGALSDVKINRIRNIRVLSNTDFALRDQKELGSKDPKIVDVICAIR